MSTDLTPTHARAAAAIDAIEDAIGGRDALVAALVQAPPSKDIDAIVNLIADPNYDATKLSAICRAGGVKLGEVLEAFKKGRYAKMFVQVADTVAENTPEVVKDVMTRAQPHMVVCYACKGTLLVYDTEAKDPKSAPKVPCKTCVNADDIPTGQILVLPDLDRQKLALELAQVLPKKSPAVAVLNDNRSVSFGDASPQGLARLLAATDEILHRRRPSPSPLTVTVEKVPPDSIDTDVESA